MTSKRILFFLCLSSIVWISFIHVISPSWLNGRFLSAIDLFSILLSILISLTLMNTKRKISQFVIFTLYSAIVIPPLILDFSDMDCQDGGFSRFNYLLREFGIKSIEVYPDLISTLLHALALSYLFFELISSTKRYIKKQDNV